MSASCAALGALGDAPRAAHHPASAAVSAPAPA
jgi:hypothetical protein